MLLLLLLASGFLTLAGSGIIALPIVLAVTFAFVLRGAFLMTGVRAHIPQRWALIGTALYLPFFAFDLYALSANFVGAALHLVLFVAVLKMFSAEQARDYAYLCVLAFLEVLAAATLSSTGIFFACFLIFTVLMVATFTAFELYRSHEDARRVAPVSAALRAGARPSGVTRPLMRFSLLLTGGVLAFTAVIFLLLPRAQSSLWTGQSQKSALTGFNDQVDLGDVASLQESDQTVMHVRIESEAPGGQLPPAALLWRGRVLESFNGQQWTSYTPMRIRKTNDGRFDDFGVDGDELDHASELLRYQVTLEPLGSPVLFYPPVLLETTTNFTRLALAPSTRTVASVGTPLGRGFGDTLYQGVSDVAQPPVQWLREAAPADSRRYWRELQLPPTLDPRIRALAHNITERYTDNWDRVQALADYLRNNYQYTLTDLPSGADPLADFLFDRRAGYCEYFATALAVMARTIGVPTRLVNGFELGPYNSISHEYLVRGRDAHAWVEAYFPAPDGGPGSWITVDATPPAQAGGAGMSQASMLLDALTSSWQEWVVDYDWVRQSNLAGQVQLGASDAFTRFSRMWQNLRQQLHQWVVAPAQTARAQAGRAAGWILAPLFLCFLGVAGFRRLRLSRRAGGPGAVVAAAARYRQFQRVLRRAGYRRNAAQTAEELVAGLPAESGRGPAERFVGSYELLRFGPAAAVPEVAQLHLTILADSLRELRRALR